MEKEGIRDAILTSLSATLSPDVATRTDAEARLKALEVTDDYGVHLARFTCDPSNGLDLSHRQMSSVLLKQYVETHWSSESEKFRAPETPENAKTEIRNLLPPGLTQQASKVRSSVAYAIAAIAHWDFPEKWPNLFQIIMQALTSGDTHAVHGGMRVLTELSRDVTDMQVPYIAPVVFPELLRIFSRPDAFSVRTRTRAVEIFSTLASLIINIDQLHKGVAKQLLYPYAFPQFIQAFIEELSVPGDGVRSDSGIKMEILKALASLTKNCGKQMNAFMAQLLPVVWTLLTQSVRHYCATVVNSTEEADDPTDSDTGEVLSFENLVFNLFDFLTSMLESSKFKSTVKNALTDLVYYLILYMQITEDQIERWNDDPDKFVEDEDEDTFSYSVRISALDLLLNLGAEIEEEKMTPALVAAIGKHIQESEALRNSSAAESAYWWKVHESVFLAVGSLKSLFEENEGFDVGDFVNGVLMRDACSESSSPYLLGRCLWTASRFCSSLDPSSATNLLSATAAALSPQQNQPACVKISAVRALYNFCDYYKLNETTEMLKPYLGPFLDGLVAVSSQFSTDVLCLGLETLALLCSIDRHFIATNEAKISPFVIAVFLKHSADPLTSSLCQDLFRELSMGPSRDALQQRLIPTLVSIMNAPPEKVENDLPSLALDILTTLVRNSPPPLSELMLVQAFPAAATMTLNSDDTSVLQSGGECLRAFLSVGGRHQLQAWHDERGNNGLFYLFQVANKVLDPKSPEFSSAYIGKLISTLFYKTGDAGDLGEHLQLLLRAVLSKMQQAETMSVIQSLCMVFAHLFNTRLEAALEFLSALPDPTGKPALEFVLTVWLARQHLFFGRYETKVSILALSKVFLHTIETNDSRIHAIQVKGDQTSDNNNSAEIQTRSKTKTSTPQFTQIPAAVKIYKLLINELNHSLEEKEIGAGGDRGEEEGGWEDEEEDDEEAVDGQAVLSDLLASGDSGINDHLAYEFRDYCDDEEEEDDPDVKEDPIYAMDIGEYLGEMIRQLSTSGCHAELKTHLTPAEIAILNKIGVA